MSDQSAAAFALAEVRIEDNQRSKEKYLPMGFDELEAFPDAICDLDHLETLSCHDCKLSALPPRFGNLVNLRELNLARTRFSEVPPVISHLARLEKLSFFENQITCVPNFLGSLPALQTLTFFGNRLESLPSFRGNYRALMELYVGRNQLKRLPDSIGTLANLKALVAFDNKLDQIPASIGQLDALERLHLGNNKLTELPEELVRLAERGTLRYLFLHGNPDLGIPVEILGPSSHDLHPGIEPQDPRKIARYWRQLQSGPTQRLNEAKVLVVGPGGHGKSSLIELLRDGKFIRGKQSTEGVKVSHWILPATAVDPALRLNVWDFGGQEIQHSTHEFFLTERAVYLLVFQPRDDQATAQGLYYWIDLIHLVAPNAPVIIVLSKQDEYEGYVNDAADLKERHPNIIDFIPISCDSAHRASANQSRLRQLVIDTVCNEIGHIRYKLPKSWMTVKEGLEQRGLDEVSYSDYQARCVQQGIDDPEDQQLLARFLHDLGTMLNYAQQMPLEQTHILNPGWVTEGVYTVVLAPELVAAEGIFDDALLTKLLSDPKHKNRYPLKAQHFIREMMLTFKLCYELASIGGRRRYLVPNALPVDRPIDVDLSGPDLLRFEIRFPRILPTSIMSRFIVAMHSDDRADRRWRLGLRSRAVGHEFLITAHPKERKIRILVSGTGPARLRALEVIRQRFALICREKEGLDAKEYTFPPGHPEAEPIPFDDLLEAERNDITTIWRPSGVGNVSVRQWLDGVSDPASRSKIQKAIANAETIGGDRTGVNVTYIEHAEQVTGTDMSNEPKYTQNISHSTFTNSPVGIQQMLQDSFNTIQNMPDTQVKQTLAELQGHVAKLLENPAIKEPETVKENLETLVKEAARPQPRRKWLELSGEGLIEAAKAVGEMATPVITTVKAILTLLA